MIRRMARRGRPWGPWTVAAVATLLVTATPRLEGASKADDEKAVAALDTEYQAAVKRNDAVTMAKILLDDFVLVIGNGTVYTKADLIKGAEAKDVIYENQEEEEGTQKVRVWGDTAVVTAKLWLKGMSNGKPFDRKLWFSDTYVRTPSGWRYAFGQASLSLPATP